jgi:hypothetical protein
VRSGHRLRSSGLLFRYRCRRRDGCFGLGRGRLLDHRRGLGLGGALRLGLGLGCFDDRLLTEPFGVGEATDAIGRGVVDARRVALHADLEPLGEIEHHLVLDAELSRQLVDPDLLRSQARCPLLPYLHGVPGPSGKAVSLTDFTTDQSRA